MPSLLKSETARANGAKSRGPKTPETKEKSALNAVRHGFTSRSSVLLPCESPVEFERLCSWYDESYKPVGYAETELVKEMAAVQWRINRIRLAETVIITQEIYDGEEELAARLPDADTQIHIGLAIRRLADESRSLALISRYESRLQRTHERCIRRLREMRTDPMPPSPLPVPPAEEKKCETNPPQPAPFDSKEPPQQPRRETTKPPAIVVEISRCKGVK